MLFQAQRLEKGSVSQAPGLAGIAVGWVNESAHQRASVPQLLDFLYSQSLEPENCWENVASLTFRTVEIVAVEMVDEEAWSSLSLGLWVLEELPRRWVVTHAWWRSAVRDRRSCRLRNELVLQGKGRFLWTFLLLFWWHRFKERWEIRVL